MADIAINILGLLITLGVLVTFHEWGHYIAARKLGVKVLKFSVGFGKPLFKKIDKNGVEWIVAAIPLGGYVKMLDEREGNVPEDELAQSFNRQPVWKRNVIAAAGPVANFLLAFLVYVVMFMVGTYTVKPVMDDPVAESIAANAGLQKNQRIVSIDGIDVSGWKDVTWALVERIGQKGRIDVGVEDIYSHQQSRHQLNIANWVVDDHRPEVLETLGIKIKTDWEPQVFSVAENGAAQKAGLIKGDIISGINGQPMASFADVRNFMGSLESTSQLEVNVLRDGSEILFWIYPQKVDDRMMLGIGAYPLVELRPSGFLDSLELAWNETLRVIGLTMTMFKKLFTGEVSPKSLGGPLSIAESAGSSFSAGLVYFLGFLAMISVNLGLVNLLPVPVLDGGHLLLNTLESIKGSPLSGGAQEFAARIGLILVLSLMAVAIFNDFARL